MKNTDNTTKDDLALHKAVSLALLAGKPNSDVVSNLQDLCEVLTSVPIGHCSYTTDTSTLQFQLYRSSNVLLVGEKLQET